MDRKKQQSATFCIWFALCILVTFIRESQAESVSEIKNFLDILKNGIPEEPFTGLDEAALTRSDRNLTVQAIIKFQRFFHLNQTGVLDINTLHRMSNPKCECKIEDISRSSDLEKQAGSSIVATSEIESEEAFTLPDICKHPYIDAATKTQDGNIYVFKGQFYWRLISTGGIKNGFPRPIGEDWSGLPGDLDASLTWSNGKTFFFKGELYWRFKNRKMDPGYPKHIRAGFPGIPDDLDAAVVWSGDGKPYFFKSDNYWRFDSRLSPPVTSIFPKPISDWKGIPNNLTGAFQNADKLTFFLKDDVYYRFDDHALQVADIDPPYPRPTSIWWFNC